MSVGAGMGWIEKEKGREIEGVEEGREKRQRGGEGEERRAEWSQWHTEGETCQQSDCT